MARAHTEVKRKHARAEHQQSRDTFCCLQSLSCQEGLSKWVRQWCLGHKFYQLSWNYTDHLAHVHESPELKLNLAQE